MSRAALMERDIKSIYHFTRLENLPSILANGIRPVSQLRDEGVIFHHNDDERHDGHRDASCFSIGFPNYRMFYTCQQRHPNSKWVILVVTSQVLDDKDCMYFYTNAANRCFREIDRATLRGAEALNRLYGNLDYRQRPADLNPKHTTDPQAEVMIFGTVEPDYISMILCKEEDIKEVEASSGAKKVSSNNYFFKPRSDYEAWA